MPWSRGCDHRRALGAFWAQKVEFVHADTAPDGLVAAIERSDAVVNLAGEPLMGGRWTAARRAVLEGSRIAVTEQLVRAMAEAKSRPRVFIFTSSHSAATDDHDPVDSHRHEHPKALEALAKRSRRSKSFLAAQAIAAFVEAENRQFDEIQQGLRELDGGRGVPHKDVAPWLRSWGQKRERKPPRACANWS